MDSVPILIACVRFIEDIERVCKRLHRVRKAKEEVIYPYHGFGVFIKKLVHPITDPILMVYLVCQIVLLGYKYEALHSSSSCHTKEIRLW
jgi:hypothetical protein